jgi:hypothetical protein
MRERLALRRWRAFLRWLQSTPKRTFVVYPLCIVAFELATRGGNLSIEPAP